MFNFANAVRHEPEIDAWFSQDPVEKFAIARKWFNVMRDCGKDIHELIHDGCPVACVGSTAFAYVNVFSKHINVGFFNGNELEDPSELLEGTGKRMRHVKIRPGVDIDNQALTKLIDQSYRLVQENKKS